jgi:hypothetical protein
MRKLALATAAVAALALSAPTFTAPAFAQDVKVKVKSGDRGDHGMRTRSVKKVVIKHGDRGMHRGFSHSRHYGYGGVKKKVIIKHGGGGKTVIKKKFEG